MLDDLIDSVWLGIYNKKREKNELFNIGIDKDKDIDGYVVMYNKIVNDELEFVSKINDLLNNAIEKKEFENLKDDVLKLIGNSCMCDVKRKGCKKDNKKNIVLLKEKAVRKIIKKKIVMIAKIIIVTIMIVMILIMII